MAYVGIKPNDRVLTSEDIKDGAVEMSDISWKNQPDNENISGTIDSFTVKLAEKFTLTGDIAISKDLTLTKLADDGEALVLTTDASSRTIEGSGTISSNTFAQVPNASLTSMTGVLDNSVQDNITRLGTVTSGTIGDTVSYPVGHPVQTVIINPDDGQGTIASASFVEWSGSNLRLTMTPRSATNLLLVEATFLFGGNNTSNLTHFQFSTVVGTTFTALPVGSAGGSRTHAHGSTRQKEHNADDCNIVHIATSYTAGAGERTFAIRAKNESGTGTKYFNATSHTGAEVAYVKPLFKVTEIQV